MESVEEILCMGGGDGEDSYATNSIHQVLFASLFFSILTYSINLFDWSIILLHFSCQICSNIFSNDDFCENVISDRER